MTVTLLKAKKEQTVIQTENLNFYYGKSHALKNINLDIKENQVTALIGPSGCGKSTFLRTLNRMNDLIPGTSTEGKILIGDLDVTSPDIDAVDLRKRVGMVFQQANPFPMSIYDNIAYGPRIHGQKNKQVLDEIVESSLRAAALWDEVKDNLGKIATGLSGGQQQRLVLARVLAVKPEIILMDEPTSALDPVSTAKLEQLIMELKKQYTIIIVTHNMQQAARVSDETAFFLNGEVVEFASTNTIFTNPKKQQTEDYISGRFG
ncbi:phosphate ABC transporter ATP-binding protein PstB [Lederbergia citrea]|uniref:Phosphate ABC transporter ATP-binding protein n=1 Tax=Lederbergia citrea TaxID=2833581 RepID=A0A942UNG6_9BACI|nr:phosphate ABC transporter ATP-binding protein PstB [Lederbergia citrea]MBS4178398.1 phosphate ABC transporter ATP-binding protein [Lederbergia citrea]MBS4205073.1 phosphate ABC transporter ATP-binding protein [Lederbergia citrea]MBS4223072.1 phosphate ABC transporter ATP-binding protein [Lederbergia citrea]